MEPYLNVRALLDEALHLLDGLGETLIAAHLMTPIAVLDDRIDSVWRHAGFRAAPYPVTPPSRKRHGSSSGKIGAANVWANERP
ncbi:hypothetical protein QP164_01840 [Sphingomonas sp. LR59]|uniref:hypothetical protein n=1 Tax=Sphingomonas sp. LR59 TaxID=3050232 RepID=UPI002FE12E66